MTSDNTVVTKNGPEGSRPVLRDGMTAPHGAAHGEAAEDMNQLKRQVSVLTNLIQESIVPVVKTLKRAYDDSIGDEPCESLDPHSDRRQRKGTVMLSHHLFPRDPRWRMGWMGNVQLVC